jgi:serine/threonine protein kinase/lipoprotein NlpI
VAENTEKVEEIYYEALQKKAGPERVSYLDTACGRDSGLRSRLESLLKANDEAGDFLGAPAFEVTMDLGPMVEGPGSMIGPYKLLEKIGEGGMAVVYMAEQQSPVRRRVALKIIQLGMDTRQVIARFEAERQALAIMDHPSIAKVFDAGATETGRPYFVMELVRGVSITEHCDRNRLTTQERLELFVPVCNAVHHAHQKGIIHRDIKPSNIMVTLHDGVPVPMVIDFGIAKATNQRLTERTVFTRYAELIGTPEYMSPEQAEMSALDIDTRTDIYSLGVVLYELLTGTLPFDEEMLRSAALGEIQRIIREVEPPRPSTRLSALGERARKIAESRRTDRVALAKRLRSELEWIPLKALRKDRNRRYRSASEFADDVQNYLKGRPLIAGPESGLYRVRKWVRRHRISVTTGLTIAVTLLAGLAISTTMYMRAQKALDALARLEDKVEVDQILSRTQRLSAEGRYEAALKEIETVLEKRDLGPKAQLLRAQIYFQVGRWVDAQSNLLALTKEGPEIAGPAHYILATIALGSDPAEAREHRRRAEEMLPNTAEAYSLRATAASTPEETLDWLCRALEIDPTHYAALKARALAYYGLVEYQKMLEDTTVLIAVYPRDPMGHALRAIARRELGQLQDALDDHDRAIGLCRVGAERVDFHDQRRVTYMRLGNNTAALDDAKRCVSLEPKEFRHHFYVFVALLSLGRYDDARETYKETVRQSPEWHRLFEYWSQKYVFDKLGSGNDLGLPSDVLRKAPFFTMQEAAETVRMLKERAERVIPGGVVPGSWSPDGKRIACERWFYLGWQPSQTTEVIRSEYASSGIEVYDLESGRKHPLTSFGGYPTWSPDGEYIAFSHNSYPPGAGEVWVIPAAGGEPRKVAAGYRPSWSRDSKQVFYRAMPEGTICRVQIDDPVAVPVHVMDTPGRYPRWFRVAPDDKHVAYESASEVCIAELASGSIISRWQTPWPLYGWRLEWSPDARELMVGSCSWYSQTGMWIWDTAHQEAKQLLRRPVEYGLWSPDASKLLIGVLDELWLAKLDPSIPAARSLASAQTLDQVLSERLQRWTRYIDADPEDAELYLGRALTHLARHDHEQARADLQIFATYITPQEKHLLYVISWWGWRYCAYDLFEAGELLMLTAAELLPKFPDLTPDFLGQRHPVQNLVSLYVKWGKPELAAKWRPELSKHGPTVK